jgi:hypothetical protein
MAEVASPLRPYARRFAIEPTKIQIVPHRILPSSIHQSSPDLYPPKRRDRAISATREIRWLDNLLYLYIQPFDVIVDPFAGGGLLGDCKLGWGRGGSGLPVPHNEAGPAKGDECDEQRGEVEFRVHFKHPG